MADDTADIGPLAIARLSSAAAIERVRASLEGRSTALSIAFCNAHTAKLAFDDPAYASLLAGMLVLNDGIGMDIAARLVTGRRFPENLNGTDFVPTLLAGIGRPLRLYLLGARPPVVARAAEVLAARYPQHVIAGYRDGYFTENDLPTIAAAVRAAEPDVLLCAMGNPLQERVMAQLAGQRLCPVLIGVGALFDFLAEAVPRAPPLVRRLRAEFLYRLIQEPRRLGRRYTIEAGAFLWDVARFSLARRLSSRRPG